MGTRSLIAVYVNKQHRVGNYVQFDGYPEGQGRGVLEFCQRIAADPGARKAFEHKVEAAVFLSESDGERIEAEAKAQGKAWEVTHPWLGRRAGSDVLGYVMNEPDGIGLSDQIEFAADSLMCEWAYVIDLDANRLEVFRGFQKKPLDADERFYPMQVAGSHIEDHRSGEDQYYPIKLLRWFELDKLPDTATFIAVLAAADNSDEFNDGLDDEVSLVAEPEKQAS
jgi:hypothetical protein